MKFASVCKQHLSAAAQWWVIVFIAAKRRKKSQERAGRLGLPYLRIPFAPSAPRCGFHLAASLTLCLHTIVPSHGEPAPPEAFVLQDFLGRAWRNECVSFPLSAPQRVHAEAGHTLVGTGGKPVPYQIVPSPDEGEERLEFLTDLGLFERRAYGFTNAPTEAETDLKIEEAADIIRLSNRLTGIAIRRSLGGDQGPVSGVLLNSGKWVGDSSLKSDQAVASYSAKVSAQGPVFAEVVCTVAWADESTWELRFRLNANEPVVIVEEEFSVEGEAKSLVLALNSNFTPDHLYYRWGKQTSEGRTGKLGTWAIDESANPAFYLEPWLHWQVSERRGNWVGMYNEGAPDLLSLAVLNPGLWVEPDRVKSGTQCPARVLLETQDGDLVATFPLQAEGRRRWIMAALDKDACLKPLREKAEKQRDVCVAPLPHQYLIKHGDFPLDTVKDYVLRWDERGDKHPRLFMSTSDLERHRKRFEPDPDLLARYLKRPLRVYDLDGPVSYYLGTGDEQLAQLFTDTAVEWVQSAVDMYLHQDDLVTLGFAPHHQTRVLTAMTVGDLALGTGLLSEEQRKRLLAQAAFLGYTVNRADYWSPERGFAANPNMTSTVNAYKCAIGCLISSHPLAKTWVDSAMEELRNVELDTWSDENGGWLEAPHYAMVSYDYLVGCFLMTYNAGFNEHLYNSKMKKVIEWLAKISTPPDARINGIRHRPPLGNSYLFEPTSEFGLIAHLWRDRDPEFAAQMQWMHTQGGSYGQPGIGGFFPTLAGYRTILHDPSIPEQAPAWKSELFPKTGVVLRNVFPSDHETQLHMIAGANHAHYDNDSGSITIWGKGSIVADDFGYYGYAPAEDHSMVESAIAGNGVMTVDAFQPGEHLDYVSGTKQGWTRQVAFVKGEDPLAPNYFVLCDSLAAPAPATWRLWLTAQQVTVTPESALVRGREDVDTDIFFASPKGIELKTEEKTRTSGSGLKPNWSWGPLASTQTGLIAATTDRQVLTCVIYPRLKTEERPKFTPLADGKVVKVETPTGTDYVFLSRTPFTLKEGQIAFEGTAGCVKLREGKPLLALGAPGRIAFGEESLRSGEITYPSKNVFHDGDFESGEQTVFPAEMRGTKVSLHKGNPLPDDTTDVGQWCAAIEVEGGRGYTRIPRLVYVDATKTYRVSMRVMTESRITATIGGYARGAGNKQLRTRDGKRVWEHRMAIHGPTEGWQTLEISIGPPGAGTDFAWPAGVLCTWIHFYFSGEDGVVYVDDIVFEER